jgi:hypothetical protein
VKQLTRSTRFAFPAALAALALLVPGGVQAQTTAAHDVSIDVDEVQLIRIVGAAAPTFLINDASAVTPGASPLTGAGALDTGDRYLQYTSVVTGTQTRKIVAKHDGDVPAYLNLNLLLASAVGANDEGDTGSRAIETRVLSTTDQDAITGIGSGYTGTAATDGWKFTYSITFKTTATLSENVALIKAAVPAVVTVTYTLTAGAS